MEKEAEEILLLFLAILHKKVIRKLEEYTEKIFCVDLLIIQGYS